MKSNVGGHAKKRGIKKSLSQKITRLLCWLLRKQRTNQHKSRRNLFWKSAGKKYEYPLPGLIFQTGKARKTGKTPCQFNISVDADSLAFPAFNANLTKKSGLG